LSGYGVIKFQQLGYNIETAAGRLPFGAGFNGFATSTTSDLGVAPLPSGATDLTTLLECWSSGQRRMDLLELPENRDTDGTFSPWSLSLVDRADGLILNVGE